MNGQGVIARNVHPANSKSSRSKQGTQRAGRRWAGASAGASRGPQRKGDGAWGVRRVIRVRALLREGAPALRPGPAAARRRTEWPGMRGSASGAGSWKTDPLRRRAREQRLGDKKSRVTGGARGARGHRPRPALRRLQDAAWAEGASPCAKGKPA